MFRTDTKLKRSPTFTSFDNIILNSVFIFDYEVR